MAHLSALSPSELQELILELEDRWGIERLYTGQPYVELMGEEPSMGMPAYDVVLLDAGPRRIQVMKALRAALYFGLRDAKDLVDKAPVLVAEDRGRAEAEELRDALLAAGAKVEIR